MKRLGAQTLSEKNNGLVTEQEPGQGPGQLNLVARHWNGWKLFPFVTFAKTSWGQAISDRYSSWAHITCEPRQSQPSTDISSEIDNQTAHAALFKVRDGCIQIFREPQPHWSRKIHNFQKANIRGNHGVQQALRLNDGRARFCPLSLRHFHVDLTSVFSMGISNPHRVCLPHIERRRRWREVLDPVYGEQPIAGLDSGSVGRPAFKHVQKGPALAACRRIGVKRGVYRMLGKK